MDLTSVIDELESPGSPFTVTRYSESYVEGVASRTPSSVFTAAAHIQPVSGDRLLALPEGRRSEDIRVMFAKVELRVGDAVRYKGVDWEVFEVQDWEPPEGSPFWRALLARQGAQ